MTFPEHFVDWVIRFLERLDDLNPEAAELPPEPAAPKLLEGASEPCLGD